MIDLTHKKIGIWGFGVVGQSVLRFLLEQEYHNLSVMDQRPIHTILETITSHSIPYYPQERAAEFFANHDYIIPSPGIDLRSVYPIIGEKIISELDLFSSYFQKKIIAITGTVGKTSVTSLLSSLLHHYKIPIITGGNIGIGSCDLLSQQNDSEYAVLETSDVQLKYCKRFSPDLAIWTNFSPNHLDWHGTVQAYFDAKLRILLHQKHDQHALVPFELASQIRQEPALANRSFHFFASIMPEQTCLKKLLTRKDILYVIDKNLIQKFIIDGHYATLISADTFPPLTFASNWLVLVAALDILQLPIAALPNFLHNLSIPEHRIEYVSTINGVDFYNDSKGTTLVATLAAINLLCTKQRPVILFLGGLSKGVDRTELIKECQKKVTRIYCFGKEAEQLSLIAQKYHIESYAHPTLEEAFNNSALSFNPQDIVLFSPAGSSYDLFENYEKRGTAFKRLVESYKNL